MNERLRLLILDDKKKGTWQDLLQGPYSTKYLDHTIFTQLERALQFLFDNKNKLHIVLSDFRLDGADGHVTHLGDVSFEKPLTTAMGANITIFVEGLMKQPDSGCTILVNKLYTVAGDYLRTYSLESHLLYEYYIDRERTLRPFDSSENIDVHMKALLEEALLEVQQFFFSQAAKVGEVLRKLHNVINLPVVVDARHIDLDDTNRVEEFLNKVTPEQKTSLREEVGAILHEYLSAKRWGTELRLPIAAIFPKLQFEFNQYLENFDFEWAPSNLKELKSLLHELEMMQRACRDNTQRFGMYLYQQKILHFFHNKEHRIGDESGRLRSAILRAAEQPPFREIFGLKEILQFLNEHYLEMGDSDAKKSFVDFFKEGVMASNIEVELPKEASPLLPFLGFNLDGQIVEHLIKSLEGLSQSLGLTLRAGDGIYSARGLDNRGLGDRIFTDKSRLLKSVSYILEEANIHAYKKREGEDQDFDREISISFRYDEELHCAKLVVEDNGTGILEGKLKTLGNGVPGAGGWASVKHELDGWVEDIWVLTNTGNKPEERAFFRVEENINEKKETRGTKVVILFNLISVIN